MVSNDLPVVSPDSEGGERTGIHGTERHRKSTAINIVSGTLKPNLKRKNQLGGDPQTLCSTALHDYLKGYQRNKTVTESAVLDMIPRKFKGKAGNFYPLTRGF